MKRRYKIILFLSYKLNAKLFKKIEDSFAKQILAKFQLVRSPKFDVKYKFLVFEKNKYNSSFIEVIKIFLYVLSVRALTRTLLFITKTIPNSEEIYELTRFKLIFTLWRHRRMIFQHLFSHLSYVYLNYDKYSTIKTLSPSHVGYKNLAENFRKFDNYIIEKSFARKNFIKFDIKDKRQKTTLDKFISWDSSIFLKFLKSHKLEEIASDYLSDNYPILALEISKFRNIKYITHELSKDTLDDIYKKNGLDYYDIILDAEIWHQRFIYSNNMIVNIDATTYPTQKFVAGSWQFIHDGGASSSQMLLLRPSEITVDLKEAIFLLGRCDENWYHLLLDTAPRLLFFDNIPLNIPVLVRSDLPSSTRRFLSKLTQRKIIEVGLDEKVRVSKLYVCPGRSTVFDSKPPLGMNWVDFSPLVLNLFRDRVLDSLGVIPDSSVPKRIIFERRASTRNVLVQEKLKKVFDDFSFQRLPLNDKFFNRQVQVFFNTKFVATPGGAVLANVIFMKPGSKVLVLKSRGNRKLNPWAKLCESFNLKYVEVTGLPTYWGSSFLRRLHSNFYISPKKLRRVLSREI